MHDWFCQIEPIESIWQKRAELRESSIVTIATLGKQGTWAET